MRYLKAVFVLYQLNRTREGSGGGINSLPSVVGVTCLMVFQITTNSFQRFSLSVQQLYFLRVLTWRRLSPARRSKTLLALLSGRRAAFHPRWPAAGRPPQRPSSGRSARTGNGRFLRTGRDALGSIPDPHGQGWPANKETGVVRKDKRKWFKKKGKLRQSKEEMKRVNWPFSTARAQMPGRKWPPPSSSYPDCLGAGHECWCHPRTDEGPYISPRLGTRKEIKLTRNTFYSKFNMSKTTVMFTSCTKDVAIFVFCVLFRIWFCLFGFSPYYSYLTIHQCSIEQFICQLRCPMCLLVAALSCIICYVWFLEKRFDFLFKFLMLICFPASKPPV